MAKEETHQEVRVILTYDAPLNIDPRIIRRTFEVLMKGKNPALSRLELMKVEVKEEGEIYNAD